jgi:predicted RND superfamily exporter protein
VNGEEMVMIRQRVRKVLPTLGILLYVTLSVFFGGLWYAALSLGVTMAAALMRLAALATSSITPRTVTALSLCFPCVVRRELRHEERL